MLLLNQRKLEIVGFFWPTPHYDVFVMLHFGELKFIAREPDVDIIGGCQRNCFFGWIRLDAFCEEKNINALCFIYSNFILVTVQERIFFIF